MLCNWLIAVQMLLNDPLQHVLINVVVPNPFGVDNDDWPAAARLSTGSFPA